MKFWIPWGVLAAGVLLSACATDFATPPYEDHPNLQVAEIARKRGDVAQAIHDYRDIIKQYPNCEKAYIGLGMALIDANAVAEAKITFEKAIALFPNSSPAYTGLGIVYLIMDQPENAINSFERALKLCSQNAKAFNGYGIALDLLNDHKAAEANYRAALELDPTNISYESNLALSLALSGNVHEAVRILERLARSPNATPRVRQNLSLAYGLLGDIKMAKKIGRTDLSDDMIMNNIGYFEAIKKTQDVTGIIPKNNTMPLDAGRKWQEGR